MLGLCGSPGLMIFVDKWSKTKSMKGDVLKAVIEESIVSLLQITATVAR